MNYFFVIDAMFSSMMKRLFLSVLFSSFISVAYGQIPLSEIEVLKTFYDATGGPNWVSETDADPNNDWVFATPLSATVVTNDWYGLFTNGSNVLSISMNPSGMVVNSNNLVGSLPSVIADLTQLEVLDLAIGELSGPIPGTITSMTNLVNLNLRSNAFSGEIPTDIGNLTNLTSLRLENNELSGQIPMSLTLLNNLIFLSLRFNDLSGEIPLAITNLTNLQRLQLGTNNFTGVIYPEYGNLVNLRTFELSNNQLTGSIPEELGNLVNVEDLRIGSQELTGTFPATLGNLTNMKFFVVRDTQIEGEIPDSYSNWTNLIWFIVNGNNLSGVLPPLFANFSNLTLFDISENSFEGQIPNLTSNTGLDSFFFDFNNFQFGDFEDEFVDYVTISNFNDNPQAPINDVENRTVCADDTITLETMASGSANVYKWFKEGIEIPDSNTPSLMLNNVQSLDSGVYTCEISSTIVTDLVLERNPITITVTDGPIANALEDIEVCDSDNDGFAVFSLDIAAIESQVLNGQTGLTVSYFNAMGDPLTLTPSYENSTADLQQITVRVEASSTCFDETVFSLIANPPATADTFSDVVICVEDTGYTLENLSANNNYYIGPGGTGTLLDSGDVITSTQTIYVFAVTGTGDNRCTDESNFTVTVTGTMADNLQDVQTCNSYVLPNLSDNNSYYTQPNGGGTLLLAGDTIVDSQTIYVRAESDGCASERNFTITIDVGECTDGASLGLPRYFTPNGDMISDVWDTSILAGTGTIFIYIYDRYGKLLKQLNPDLDAAWDGEFNGKPMPATDYWFQYVDTETGKSLTGHFALKR
ncbi:T9SS type B sorting domain-containing protein [Maribacter sp. 2210JD10-5]|uniref:T9SS type B sorting domain-containing protein n=1 Tax=Maribacter sp. 2210JD10-5 TaxID=3386272 RepID=UPI0039BD3EA4